MHSSTTCLCSTWLGVETFARGADWHQAMHLSDLPFDQPLEAPSSTSPPLKGVINAVNEPLNMGCS
jgi:hypothetical protein